MFFKDKERRKKSDKIKLKFEYFDEVSEKETYSKSWVFSYKLVGWLSFKVSDDLLRIIYLPETSRRMLWGGSIWEPRGCDTRLWSHSRNLMAAHGHSEWKSEI